MSQLLTEIGYASVDEAELDLVRQIQSTFGPERCYAWPGARVAARRMASVGFGGDFHNVTHGPDGQHSVVVGTVAGPGLLAALAKAVISGAIHKFGPVDRSPASFVDCLSELIDRLNTDLRPRRVTCSVFHGLIDCVRGTLGCCTVGRIRPYIKTRDGALRELPVARQALGRPSSVERAVATFELGTVERLILHTNGLTEARASSGQSYGMSRGRRLLTETASLPADQQVETIVRALHAHTGPDSTLADDVTVFVAEFAEQSEPPLTADSVRDLFKSYEGAGGSQPDSSVFLG